MHAFTVDRLEEALVCDLAARVGGVVLDEAPQEVKLVHVVGLGTHHAELRRNRVLLAQGSHQGRHLGGQLSATVSQHQLFTHRGRRRMVSHGV